MARKKDDYKYLLYLYSYVNECLSGDVEPDSFPNLIVSFCTVVERILKIKLHKKNPVLVFDLGKFGEDDNKLAATILKKEDVGLETIKFSVVINRFGVFFKKTFSPEALEALREIHKVRNYFIHGYKPDSKISLDQEDIVKKMGTAWEQISSITTSLFGKNAIKNNKPKKKYTEEELEEVLTEEVRELINQNGNQNVFGLNIQNHIYPYNSHLNMDSSDRCPRCGGYSFSFENDSHLYTSVFTSADTAIFGTTSGSLSPGLYRCKNCNLELTKKQYEIARKKAIRRHDS